MNKPIPELPKLSKPITSSKYWDGGIDLPLAGERASRLEREDQLRDAFERIGRVEHERNQLRATRLEDALTIANQRALLDKYDADNTALMQENAKLKARTLSCVFCGDPMESVEALKKHSADCPKHPAVIESSKLKAQVERLSDPVTSVEEISSLATFDNALRNHCGRKQSENAMEQALGWLIASRSAGKEERTTYPHEGHCSCSSYLPVGSPGCCCNRKRMEEHHA